MIIPVVSSLVLMKRRVIVELLPQSVRDWWKKWELRGLIIVSLISQILLILLGNRRKYDGRLRLKCVVWSAYLLADSVATMALGLLLNNLGQIYHRHGCSIDANNELTAFWAPFFLLHLGGPDTITAYSLEDNELYLRHLFGLIVQTGAVLYIFLLSWNTGSHLSYLAIAMIVVGCIKYGERTWTLWSASSDQLRDSMLTNPDPGPNYPKFMDEFSLKHAEGFCVEAEEVKDDQAEIDVKASGDTTSDVNIVKANALFQIFKCLFADLILSFQDRDISQSLFLKFSHADAFDVIAIELAFMYDLLYTKAIVINTTWGLSSRFITTFLTTLVLLIFSISDKKKYHKVDLYITFCLLIVAILLEIIAAVSLFLSDEASLWFNKHKQIWILKAIITCLEPVVKLPRWSNSMGQYSITSLCLKEKTNLSMPKWFHLNRIWEQHRYRTSKKVPEGLKKLIFKHVLKKCYRFNEAIKRSDTTYQGRDIYTNRGIRALRKYYGESSDSPIDWSIQGFEFDQSILVWHVATEFCYYSGTQGNSSDLSGCTNRKISKLLSRYMLYLLVIYPSLLPVGIGLIRFRDTRSEARKFLEERKYMNRTKETHGSEKTDQKRELKIQACKMLLKVKTHVPPIKVKGDMSKSVLFDASRLASELNKISDEKRRWKLIRDVWFEILTYAASQGRGSHHARQLKRGGEFLTHVWLLMAHFGMTDQFQISQGHARAKLTVK
ncbi:uncharacterized protein LOC116137066 [Pistacia vera]|uniref:uncharacterized protein LOC116137066 n=1 Tax=Pistacia vera TaxID=55513 RepID=UPI0012630A35|nr:uncharacterized protein LOC116137066 [Pistacia vera]